MLIRTPRGDYRVIRIPKDELSVCFYLAEECGREDEGSYLLMEWKNPALFRELLTMFMELAGNTREDVGTAAGSNRIGDASDFKDCFTKDGHLWAVFSYYEGTPFAGYAGRAASPAERLQVWESLLERILFQGLPAYLQYEAADLANLVVDDASSVHANYLLNDLEGRNGDLFFKLQKRLAAAFRLLFARELERGDDAAREYAGRLDNAEFADGRDIYRGFRTMRQRTDAEEAQREGQEEAPREGILIRIWTVLFSHAHTLLKFAYVLLVAALWMLFVWLCIRPEEAPEQRNRIAAIGTVEIPGSEDENENGP